MDIAPGKPLSVLLQDVSETDNTYLQNNELYLQRLAKLESITTASGEVPESATALVGNMKVLIPLAGLIDKDAELARLGKEIEKLEKSLKAVEGKLNNKSFVDKAPEAVVDKEKTKAAEMKNALDSLNTQKQRIEQI